MTEAEQRQRVIDEALSWQKTPHHNGARIKGIGCDCGQFPLAVYEAAGMIPPTATQRYSPQFHLHKDEEWYLKYCQQLGRELPEGSPILKGDFLIYKVGRVFSHGVIVVDWPSVIHSYAGVGVTLDHANTGWMMANKDGSPRARKHFTLW